MFVTAVCCLKSYPGLKLTSLFKTRKTKQNLIIVRVVQIVPKITESIDAIWAIIWKVADRFDRSNIDLNRTDKQTKGMGLTTIFGVKMKVAASSGLMENNFLPFFPNNLPLKYLFSKICYTNFHILENNW